ncbi:MAG: DUF655 domain-containing protein [Candidatus Micrarchaeota archaeon]
MPNEEHAIVLDYLPRGKSSSVKTEPIAQVLGTDFFSLLEVIPKRELKIGSSVYIGKDTREDIELIKRRIPFKELTSTAAGEIEKAVEAVVAENQPRFVDFLNNSNPITLRRHQLELIPGIGKKHVFLILDERQKKPFSSFMEFEERISGVGHIQKAFVRRIMTELEDEDEKHHLFTRFPPREREMGRFDRERRF